MTLIMAAVQYSHEQAWVLSFMWVFFDLFKVNPPSKHHFPMISVTSHAMVALSHFDFGRFEVR